MPFVLFNFSFLSSIVLALTSAVTNLSNKTLIFHGRDPFNQTFWKFRSKTQWIGSVQPEKFRKNGSTFWGGPLFPVGPVGILVEWIAPHDFHGPKIKFHDFPGLENEILKIHDLTCTHPVVWCHLVILFQNIYTWVSQWVRETSAH